MFEDTAQVLEVIPPTALESMQRAEIDMQIATAKRYPRNIGKVKKDMLSFATLDLQTAEGCFYKLPRGGKAIEGPSVRLAEIAVACYGNLRAATRIISTQGSGPEPHVVIQSVCHDLEVNTAISIEKRCRVFKKKNADKPDEDDINLAANRGSAIAFRDAVFKVIPLALIKPVYAECKKIAIGDAKTLGERRERWFISFSKMGISEKRVLAMLEKESIDQVGLAEIETLLGVYNSIKEGVTTIDNEFPADSGATVERLAGAAKTESKSDKTTEPAATTPTKTEPAAGSKPHRQNAPPTRDPVVELIAVMATVNATVPELVEGMMADGHLGKPGHPNPNDIKLASQIPVELIEQYLGADRKGAQVLESIRFVRSQRG